MDLKIALQQINQELNNLPLDRKPNELYEPVKYFLNIGGKRMRPLLALQGCYLFDSNYQKALKPSLAVELFHNFSLIHDDIMDNAPLRRGFKTVHEKWNANVAILAGDVTLIEAYELLAHCDPAIRLEIFQKFNLTAKQVCEGQQIDMNFETQNEVSIDEYTEMIAFKTAVLLAFSFYMGARIGGASPLDAQKMYDCALNLGISFQIKDDLLDVFGESAKVGKMVGGDIVANKKTFLLINALKLANENQKAALQQLISDKCIAPNDKVENTIAIYNQLNIKEITEKEIKKYFDKAMLLLSEINAEESKKEFLKIYFTELFNRES